MVTALGRSIESIDQSRPTARRAGAVVPEQLGLFGAPHPVVDRLRALDINTMTPLQALEQLARLIEDARSGNGNV